jgi:hypothetical protein
VPVVAVAVGFGLLALSARALEDAGRELSHEVARLGELRWSLASLRSSARDTDRRVEAFRARHATAPDGPGDGG